MTSKDASIKQEKHIAEALGGSVQAGSGGTTFGGGDVHTKDFFIEAKTVTSIRNSYSVTQAALTKMKHQAYEQRKPYCAFAFRFSPEGEDHYVIDEHLMKKLVEYLEKE